MDWEAAMRERAEIQQGLLAKFHVPQIGCTAHHWWRAIRSGRWDRLSARVLRLHGSPESDEQRVLAAVLDASPGAILHGPSALAWFSMRGYNLARVKVARPRGLSGLKPELAEAHRLREIRAHDVIVVRGVATETPLRAIWSEAARFGPDRLHHIGLERIGRLLDDAHVKRLVTWEALHEMVDDIGKRGRAGTELMRELASERQPGSSPNESRNEDRFELICRAAGIQSLRRQPTLGGLQVIGRTDYRDKELPLAVEVNSISYHTTPSDRADDEARYARLNDAGFVVAVVWEDDIWSRRTSVVETVRVASALARTNERAVVHSPSCPWPDPTRLLGTRICA